MSHTHILVSFCSNWWSWNSTRRYKIRVQPLSRLADYGLHPWRDEIIRRINRPGKMYKEPMWTVTLHCLQTKQSNKNKQIIASYCDAVFHSRSWLGMLSKPKVNKKRGGTWRRSPDLWHVANSKGVFKRWNGNEKHYSSTLRTRKCDRPHSRTEVKTTAGVWVRKYVLHSELKTLKGLHLVQVPSDMLDHYTEQRLLGQKEGVVQEERYWKRVENVLHRSVWDYWCRTLCLLCSCRSVAVRLSLAHLSLCAVW